MSNAPDGSECSAPVMPAWVQEAMRRLRGEASDIIRNGRVSRRAGHAEYLVMILTDTADHLEVLANQPAAVQKGYKNGLDAALRTIADIGIADSEAQTNGREDAYRAVEALAAQQGAGNE